MNALTYMPNLDEAYRRMNERAAAENAAAERAEAIETCKRIIDDPRGYSDEQLREVCGFYMSYGDGGVHYLRADAHIWAINRREKIERIAPETPRDVLASMRGRFGEIAIWGAVGAVALLAATGWL